MRENFLYIFIGHNRTGKSSIARKQVIAWKKANPGKLVICHDPQRRFKGLYDIEIGPEDLDWAVRLCSMRNCLVVIDDLRVLSDSSHPPKGLKQLMYGRCDWNIDIMCIFHNPSEVLNTLTGFATHYFIFYTNASKGKFEDKLPNYELCLIASDEVNKYVKIFGRGTWPKCDFPYIVVDTEKQKLMAINMNNKQLPAARK